MARPDDAQARRYLLGALSPEDEAAFEDRWLADPEAYERLLAAEARLLDDHVRRRLTPEERARFDGHYLAAPRGRERAELVESLQTLARRRLEEARPRSGVVAWARAAAIAGVALLGAWALVTRRPAPPAGVPAAGPSLGAAPPAAIGDGRAALPRVRLAAGRTRGGPGIDLAAPGPEGVVLELEPPAVPEAPARFAASITTAEDDEVWRQEPLAAERQSGGSLVVVRVPGDRLPPGDYVVVLRRLEAAGTRPAAEYFFRVTGPSPGAPR
jgi:hypothetical protein